jgi:hypothetical protein
MRHVKKASLGVFLLFLAVTSCNKDSNHSGNGAQLSLSSTSLQRGQPLLISTALSDNNTTIRWSLHPSNGTTIMPSKNHAEALFGLAGHYGITASYYSASDSTKAYDSSTAQIVVSDTIYASPPPATTDSLTLAGDELTLVPVSATDTSLIILAKTTRLYNCIPYLTAFGTAVYPGRSLYFDFRGILVVEGKGDCAGVQNPAVSYVPFATPLIPGSYELTATLNGVDYSGSLTVTDTYYQFNWNYTSGIIISPTTLKIDR